MELSKEEQQKEIEKCKSIEYFYENYCRKEGMPEYSEKAYKEYLEFVKLCRYMSGTTSRRSKSACIMEYPMTIDEAIKFKK